jgi:hypothetical protein
MRNLSCHVAALAGVMLSVSAAAGDCPIVEHLNSGKVFLAGVQFSEGTTRLSRRDNSWV